MGGGTNLFVATSQGVFRASRNGGAGETHALGLQDHGGIRWLLADCDDPARRWSRPRQPIVEIPYARLAFRR